MSRAMFFILTFLLITTSIFAGGDRFLLWESFEDITPPALPSGWLVNDNNGDGLTWESKKYGGLGERPQCIRILGLVNNDDWFFTQGLLLDVGKTYTISFRYKVSQPATHKMNICLGSAQNPVSMTTQIYDNSSLTDTIMTLKSQTFTVSSSGIYFVGFHCYSNTNPARLFVDDILVSYPETDLSLKVVLKKEFLASEVPAFSLTDTIESISIIKNNGLADLIMNQRCAVGSWININPEMSYLVITPSGDSIPFGLMVEESEVKTSDFKSLSPGNVFGKIYSLQTPFTFSELGTHTLFVQYKNYHKNPSGDAWLGRIISNPITFIVQ